MTREERCKLAIERGFTYDSETGLINNRYGKQVKTIDNKGYCRLSLQTKNKFFILTAHIFAWYTVYKECVEEIDHINGIRDDNRICNLRSVTRSQNQWNRTTAKGYTYNKVHKKFQAQIYINYKNKSLGLFETEEEARNAYLAAKQIYHVI
jgi:hypothetical protein